jgi:hypothetical protein
MLPLFCYSHEQKTITNLGDKTSSKSFNVQKSQTVGDERSTCPTEEDKKSPSSSVTSTDNIIADHTSSAAEDGLLAQEKSVSNHTGVPTGGSELSTTEIKEVGDKKAESMDDMVPGTLNNNKKVNVSSDVHLNIRLPDGVSLQEKFSVTSTLRTVKDYVDRNQASGIGAYDLAIPYPRKTFSDQGMHIKYRTVSHCFCGTMLRLHSNDIFLLLFYFIFLKFISLRSILHILFVIFYCIFFSRSFMLIPS